MSEIAVWIVGYVTAAALVTVVICLIFYLHDGVSRLIRRCSFRAKARRALSGLPAKNWSLSNGCKRRWARY